jgi:hypothetical protein
MIKAQGGIFGWVTDSARIVGALGAGSSNRMRNHAAH